MRLDYVSIFPDYLAPLSLSLPGRAVAGGLLEIHVHDLRDWTHDRHRTVDDTPYGGGAGMVMKPGPWGEALDELLGPRTTVVVPTPSGAPLTQAMAADLAGREHLLFACGRYEGIDQRVVEHAATRAEVLEISVGDYVLNGGEAAALVITEAVVRLLPGFMNNPASVVEESHAPEGGGLLEHPVYTKPASWRDLDVPDVLRGGDHGAVARWRHQQALARTAARRPDLLHPSTAAGAAGEWEVVPATRGDAPELLVLQLACWVTEAILNDDLGIPPLHEGLEDVLASIETWQTYVVRAAGRLVGSVRGRLVTDDETGGAGGAGDDRGQVWEVGRLMAAPDLRGLGLGRALLEHAERVAPPGVTAYRLVTGRGSEANLRRYKRAGYRVVEVLDGRSGPVVLAKDARRVIRRR